MDNGKAVTPRGGEAPRGGHDSSLNGLIFKRYHCDEDCSWVEGSYLRCNYRGYTHHKMCEHQAREFEVFVFISPKGQLLTLIFTGFFDEVVSLPTEPS